MTDKVKIFEVSPRDGLQNETTLLDVHTKVELVRRLLKCGLGEIEAGAFVSPKWVPQMTGSAEVFKELSGQGSFWALVPNKQGYDDAFNAGARRMAVFTAASETFSRKNTNASISESLQRISEVASLAQENGVSLRGYISCALGCPYEGQIAPESVVAVALRLKELGCSEISIGDTIGSGTISTTRTLFQALCSELPSYMLAAHFHDTYGQALVNLVVALEHGVRTIDASVAGLGGCPYAPGASGNVATEDVARFCEGQGLETGLHQHSLAETGAWISQILNRPSRSRTGQAILSRISK